ncbi:Cloroperoxidase, partial [Ceraceosorus guamensis]
MKLTTSFSLLAVALAGAQSVLAFPEYASRSHKDFTVGQIVRERVERRTAEGTQFPKRLLGLDGLLEPLTGVLSALGLPAAQKQGAVLVPDAAHPYKAPGPTDIRGLCPTLNTMANHGYIARNGITTFAEASNGCQQAFGFSYDLCTFLSALGLLAGGDILSGKMSIGGPDSRVPNTLGKAGELTQHGVFEIDGSMTRADTYFGNNHNFQLDRWNNIVKMANENGGKFDNTMWKKERKQTYDFARANNPEFYAGVKYIAVSIAER